MDFTEKWLTSVERKNSILCAGIDPAEYAMGRTEKGEGLPAGASKRDFVLRYIESVAQFCSAVKFNVRYFGSRDDYENGLNDDLTTLTEAAVLAKEKDLVVIQDSKEADIGSTNDAGLFYARVRGVDAVTIAAFAGNWQEAANQAKDRGLGLIGMCLMSNPDYEAEKNKWVDVRKNVEMYDDGHVIQIQDPQTHGTVPHVRQYIKLANDAKRFGYKGLVIGAPSKTNHIKDDEVATVEHYFPEETKLIPGIGAQGGEVSILARHFEPKRMICNVGRGLMFPKGAYTTPEDQAEAAQQYQEMLNSLRQK